MLQFAEQIINNLPSLPQELYLNPNQATISKIRMEMALRMESSGGLFYCYSNSIFSYLIN